MKNCKRCSTVKTTDEFYKDKSKKDGLTSFCIPCRRSYEKAWYSDNSDHVKAKAATWAKNNKERAKETARDYYLKNIESFKVNRKARYWMDPEGNSRKSGQYHLAKVKSDPYYRFVTRCRKRVWAAFFENGYSKKTKTFALVGCSQEELSAYIESKFQDGMTWDNYGQWHLDHRLPFSAAKTEGEVEMLCHYSNLQPLWASDNLAKNARYCEDELAAYFKARSE